MLFNDRRAVKSALKAANRPSRAPKGYKPDTAGRKAVRDEASPRKEENIHTVSRKTRYNNAAMRVDRSGSANSNDPWTSPNSNIKRK